MMEDKRVILNYHRDLYVHVQDDNFLTDDDILVINQENEAAIVYKNVSTLLAKVMIQENEVAIVYKNASTLFAKVMTQENEVTVVYKNVSTPLAKVLIQVNEVATVYKNVLSVPNKLKVISYLDSRRPFIRAIAIFILAKTIMGNTWSNSILWISRIGFAF